MISFQKLPNAPFTRLMKEVAKRDELIGGHLEEFKVHIILHISYHKSSAHPIPITYLCCSSKRNTVKTLQHPFYSTLIHQREKYPKW